jgi:hypothetical protein
MTKIINITLAAVGLALIIGVILMLTNSATGATRESTCRSSIILSQKTEIDFVFKEFSTPRICQPPSEIEIIQGTREDIKYQISELAAKCWWMWLEGQLSDIFKNSKDNTGCGVCYYFAIGNEMDKGEPSNVEVFEEPSLVSRSSTKITEEEMYHYLMSKTYEPKLLYGGGTKQYIGDHYNEFTGIPIPIPQEIRLSKDIDAVPITHLTDFTGIVTKETTQEITKLGEELMEKSNSLLLVIVADSLQRNERQDARRLIERLNMNSNKNTYDAVLITIDATKGHIRIHMGGELEIYFNELELGTMMGANFNGVVDSQTLDVAIRQLIQAMIKKVQEPTRDEGLPWSQKSFYAYLTNDGLNQMHLTELEKDVTYAIAYASESTVVSYFRGILANDLIISFNPFNLDQSAGLSDRWKALIGQARLGSGKNSIIIERAQDMNQLCRVTR